MIQEQLKEAIKQTEETLACYRFELEQSASGKLYCITRNGRLICYQQMEVDGKTVRKGITKNTELVQELARKEYLKKVIPSLEGNLLVLRRALQRYKPCLLQEVIAELTACYKRLPESYFFNPQVDYLVLTLDEHDRQRIDSHKQWGLRPYKVSSYRSEGRTVITSRGERMRSKAEVMIAEKLYEYGIPFRYEQELSLGDLTLHPDFTFEGANGEEFYLEFCGMMDDSRYVSSHLSKVAAYQAAGIVPWKNIIYLYSSGNEMNMQRVDSMIRTQIIPWL